MSIPAIIVLGILACATLALLGILFVAVTENKYPVKELLTGLGIVSFFVLLQSGLIPAW